MFHQWIAAAREIYNFILLDVLRPGLRKANWMALKQEMTGGWPDHLECVPFQIKGLAIKKACDTFFDVIKRRKRGESAEFRPQKRKDPVQSCFIPKTAVKTTGIYPLVSGKGLRFAEPVPEDHLDCRMVLKVGKFYLMTPYKVPRIQAENQGRVVALDPGIRDFLAFYSEDHAGRIGVGDFSRIQRLAFYLDDLLSRASKAGKQKKLRMIMAADRMRERIANLVNELHKRAAHFLVTNFDVILLPTFETSQMVSKAGRKLLRKSVRAMLTFAHYRFKLFLKNKADEFGKAVIDVCEAYTSKTNPITGQIFNVGSAKRIKTDLGWIDRDISGARNILLRALADRPQDFTCADVRN
jgi:putative transposase